jgi:hypothetical protein
MTESRPIRPQVKPSEEGYVMLIAVFFVVLLTLSLSVAVPVVIKSIQRDRELETFHRGMQYRRAVQLYYRKFSAYPPNIEALIKTNNIRFLRKRYLDPITNKDDWKPVRYGQNKTPTVMGFFGQTLAGNASTLSGTGPSGGNSLTGGTSAFSGSSTSSGQSLFGSSSSSSDTGSTSTGSSSDTSSSATSTGSSSSSTSTSSTGLTGQTFGGGGIIGFSPGSPRQSILVYKKKNHYNEWEFTYDPLADRQTQSNSTGAAGQASSSTTSTTGSSTFGSSSTFGTSSSSSSSSTSSSQQ